MAQVEVRGGAARQVQIRIDPERLSARGLSLNDVREAIGERNQDISGGEIDSGKRSYLLRTVGRFDDLVDLENMILARRADSLTRLRDVAAVELDHFRIRDRSYCNGSPVISLAVQRESGSNVIRTKEDMQAEIELINQELLNPEGMQLRLTADDVVYVQASIINVWKNLLLGALLSTLIMYLFMRSLRATAVGVIGIPICTIAAFLGLMLAGRTINVISLAGVALAIGMTLDNSIVVLESIELERRRGLDRLKAAVSGVQKVWPAVLASTLTTIMVFLPVVFIAEEAGQLYSDVAIAIAASILVSMLVAITVIPTISARLDCKQTANPQGAGARSSLSLAQPLLQIRPDRERVAEVGMSSEDIGFAIAALTDGAYVNEFILADDKIDMYLYNQQGPGATLETLDNIAVYTPSGQTLLLSELTRTEESVDTSTVRRKDGRRTITLNIIPPRSVPLEAGVEIVRRDVVAYLRDNGEIPTGVNLSISGAADQLDATRESLAGNYLVALIIVYLLMVAIFSHWGYPLLIMTTIPLGIAGGIAGLALLNLTGWVMQQMGMNGFTQPFDMISMLGFLILMGTVVNNPILIVDRAIRNGLEDGMNPVEAVNEAVASRLRPIAISTITTICGLAPLVFLPGAGSELYRGVGVIVMAGIIGATLVTLTMLPALTIMVLQWQEKRLEQKRH